MKIPAFLAAVALAAILSVPSAVLADSRGGLEMGRGHKFGFVHAHDKHKYGHSRRGKHRHKRPHRRSHKHHLFGRTYSHHGRYPAWHGWPYRHRPHRHGRHYYRGYSPGLSGIVILRLGDYHHRRHHRLR